MKITFLGTSAANAFPEAFCACVNCLRARELGGPNLRKRSSALINDDLLIDLGPDIMSAAQLHGCPLTKVRYCLQTHGHADHLDASHFLSRSPGYGVVGTSKLHFYASTETLRWAERLLERDFHPGSFLDAEVGERLNLTHHTIEPLQSFQVGPYRVTAFPANHDYGMGCLLYAIEAGGRSVFYGTDTAALPETVWRIFHENRAAFDLVILDHTYGPGKQGDDHLSANEIIEYARRMREEGIISSQSRVFGTHIAHDANPAHPELVEFAAANGYEIAFDGLTVETPR